MAHLDVDAAVAELQAKSIKQIERATAIAWGGRAAAAFRLATEAAGTEKAQRWLMDGENYRQESLEHAAMTEDFGFLQEIAAELQDSRAEAIAATQAA